MRQGSCGLPSQRTRGSFHSVYLRACLPKQRQEAWSYVQSLYASNVVRGALQNTQRQCGHAATRICTVVCAPLQHSSIVFVSLLSSPYRLLSLVEQGVPPPALHLRFIDPRFWPENMFESALYIESSLSECIGQKPSRITYPLHA